MKKIGDYYIAEEDNDKPNSNSDEVKNLALKLFLSLTVQNAASNPAWSPDGRAKHDAAMAIAASKAFFELWRRDGAKSSRRNTNDNYGM